MESSSTSKRVAFDRSYDDRGSVCYGVGVDDKRERQPVCDGTSGCQSFRTRKPSIQVPVTTTSR